jgi:RNA polymerase sigma-70 factor, ECF subfamily
VDAVAARIGTIGGADFVTRVGISPKSAPMLHMPGLFLASLRAPHVLFKFTGVIGRRRAQATGTSSQDNMQLATLEIAMTPPFARFADSTLIKLALAGQTECFAVLIDRHKGAVRRRIASMVQNEADADDLLQEALLKVWHHLPRFRSESSFRTWMTRIAINEAFQAYRRERCRPIYPAPGDLDTFASHDESPHQSVARVELTHTVRRAVERLPLKYSQVLILRDLEQLSQQETARCLQSNIPTVKSRLFRARQKLLAALQRSGIRGLASAA